jgi:hypothetical protein
MMPGRGMIPRLFWCTSPMYGPCWSPSAGVDLPGVKGSLSARRGGRRVSGRKGPSGAFREEVYLARGPTGEIGGTAPASPIASDFADGRGHDVDV